MRDVESSVRRVLITSQIRPTRASKRLDRRGALGAKVR